MKIKHMRIAIDIDSTMNQAYHYDYIHGMEICKEFNHPFVYKGYKCSVKEQFQMGDKLYNEYMRRYFPWNVRENKLLPICSETIRMYQMYHEIFIMTARDPEYDTPVQPYKGPQMVKDTYEWLKKNNILVPKENILFGVKEKGVRCKELGIDVLIDDDPKNILNAIENGINVCMMVYPYNQHLIGTSPYIYPLEYGWVSLHGHCV